MQHRRPLSLCRWVDGTCERTTLLIGASGSEAQRRINLPPAPFAEYPCRADFGRQWGTRADSELRDAILRWPSSCAPVKRRTVGGRLEATSIVLFGLFKTPAICRPDAIDFP